jgi:peptidyl-prolyl cis-trans isomerase D
VQVTEDEIKRVYDANKRTYETPEKRVLEQIKFKSEAAARDAKAKLAAGKTFEEVAKAEGFKPEDIKLGEVGKDNTTIPKVAFELPLNTASDPVRGPFGWVILRALSSTPGTLKTLAEVHDEIRDRIAAERSKDKLFELTSDFEDALGAGKTLEEAATAHKLVVTKVTIDGRGNDAEGKTVDGLPGGEFLQRVFAAERATDSGLVEAGEGAYFEFRVDDVKPTAKKPFAEVRADVLADWRAQELDKRLQAIADDLVKKGNAGKSMAELAAPLGVAPLTSDPLPRYGDNRTFGAETVTAAHEAKVGAYFKGPVADGKSVVVGRLASIQYEAEAPNAPLRATYSSRLREVFANDFAEQLGTAVRNEVGVTVDEARFQTFHTGE